MLFSRCYRWGFAEHTAHRQKSEVIKTPSSFVKRKIVWFVLLKSVLCACLTSCGYLSGHDRHNFSSHRCIEYSMYLLISKTSIDDD